MVRECLSGYMLLVCGLLTGRANEIAPLPAEVTEPIGIPAEVVVSDEQTSIQRAVERALPGVPHQLC
jgi:hypothetical protein